MKNLDKMKSLLESGEVDALLLTSEVNRHYAAQYNIAEGVAVVCKNRKLLLYRQPLYRSRRKKSAGLYRPDG